MQPVVYQFDRSKVRRYYIWLLAVSMIFAVLSLTDFISEYSETASISWFDLVAAILFAVFALLFLARITGLNAILGEWEQASLSLDDDGLTYAHGWPAPRRWSWSELSAFEYVGPAFLRQPSVQFRPATAAGWRRWTMHMTLSGLRVRLPNIFDAPPKEIAAKLNEYRDRALGAS